MRKILLIIAGALAMTANSAPRQLTAPGEIHETIERHKNIRPVDDRVKALQFRQLTKGTDATRATGIKYGVNGMWTFQFGDYYFDDSALEPIFVNFDASIEEGQSVWFESVTGNYLPFTAYFDPRTNGMVFPRALLGTTKVQGATYYVYQEPYIYDTENDRIVNVEEITSLFYPDAGILEFALDNGLSWMAYFDEAGTNRAGYFDIYDFETARQIPEEEDDDDWTDIGNAVLIDGWVLPGFYQDALAMPYEVPAQQNKENPNLYRLVGPYHTGPVADVNEAQNVGYIKFDVSDPDHVVFYQVDSGFSNFALLQFRFYCYNQLGHFLMEAADGTTVKEMVEKLGNTIPYTTFRNGIVKLSFIDQPDNNNFRLYDANFGNQIKPLGGYIWTDVSMLASITLPSTGVDSLDSDNILEPTYYNLQGLKIENPSPGQLVIVKKGRKSEKVIFK